MDVEGDGDGDVTESMRYGNHAIATQLLVHKDEVWKRSLKDKITAGRVVSKCGRPIDRATDETHLLVFLRSLAVSQQSKLRTVLDLFVLRGKEMIWG